MSGYAELHCLSNFSFLRGASHPGELVGRAAELGYTALAVTDECSMAGVVRAHDAAKQHKLKLIVGAEFRTPDDLHLVLLAPTQTAYAEICALITRARLAADKGTYRLTRADFPIRARSLSRAVGASRRAARQHGRVDTRAVSRTLLDCSRAAPGRDDAARLARLQQLGAHMACR
jgi:error-prone DNA polymerase